MTNERAVDYWVKNSNEDLATAESLFMTKRYVHCLFFCHLFVEKIIKALVVKKTQENPLPIHNLPRLIKSAGISLSAEQARLLDGINEFNIRARYNDVKFRFHRKATGKFTQYYFKESKKLYSWLKEKLKK